MRQPVILFDGGCTLCNRMVAMIIARDRARRFRLAPLHSAVADALLREADAAAHNSDAAPPIPSASLDTLIVIDGGCVWVRSDAALRIARGLPLPWSMLGICRWLPRRWRDAIYCQIAARRSRWFGRQEMCLTIAPERLARVELKADAPNREDGGDAARHHGASS